MKEIQIGPTISAHDEAYKVKKILDMLSSGNQVKITMLFKGRMITHTDLGLNKLNSVINKIEESKLGKVSAPPKLNGKRLSVIINFRKMKLIKKLVTVTHRELPISIQAVQSTHAALDFVLAYPDIAKDWHESNYLIQLTLATKAQLEEFVDFLSQTNLKFFVFREPDLNNDITAICIEPSELTRTLTKKFKLL